MLASLLVKHGFKLREGYDTPLLVQHYMLILNEDMKDTIALTTSVAIHQRVRLRRLDLDLTLPVGTVATGAIGRKRDLEVLYRQ